MLAILNHAISIMLTILNHHSHHHAITITITGHHLPPPSILPSAPQERRAELPPLTLHEGLAAAARQLAQRQRVCERQATGCGDQVVISEV